MQMKAGRADFSQTLQVSTSLRTRLLVMLICAEVSHTVYDDPLAIIQRHESYIVTLYTSKQWSGTHARDMA